MKRSEQVLEAVAAKHKLRVKDILGRDKFAFICAARREAVLEMVALGMTHGTIAKAMCRERSTILQYASERRAAYKSKYFVTNKHRWMDRAHDLATS